MEHPSLYVRFPLQDRPGESLVVWTTTPWTLPANVGGRVKPDAEYALVDGDWSLRVAGRDDHTATSSSVTSWSGGSTRLPSATFPPRRASSTASFPGTTSHWTGNRIVHIAPGAGAEDFELSREFDGPVLAPIDEGGRMLPGFGFDGLTTTEVADPVIDALRERGLLVREERIVHRYPICWRCKTPLVFRVVDDWFISAQEIRQPMLDANDTVEWTPPQYKKRMDDCCATWATGTSRASATSGCRCRSIRATAAI